MMQLKEYQRNTLDAFSRWLETLGKAKDKAETGIAALKEAGIDSIPDDLRNYPKTAWEQLKQIGGDRTKCRRLRLTHRRGKPPYSTYLFQSADRWR